MNQRTIRTVLALGALAAFAGAARAETAIRFDSVAPKTAGPQPTLLQSLREATKDLEVPVAKEAGAKAEKTFWGSDGQWCDDGRVYRGGPCDNTGHWRRGSRDPWSRDPSREGWGYGRSPYDQPWRRGPGRREDPYRRGPYRRDPYRRYP
ncbi:MAG: hypothetical protein HY925_06200 [Elusimicrobia bacterium]|nr:hypothetical protein [Elusimicrobiota bacterium]